MSWNIGGNKNLFLKFYSKLELSYVAPAFPKPSLEKLKLTVFEMQQMPDIEKTDSKEETSCLKGTKYNGRRKTCVNFQIDTDKLNTSEFIYQATLTYSTCGALYWMKHCS